MKSDSTSTDFSKKCEILDELWMNYRDELALKGFVEYNDLALPLAFAINEGIVETTPQAAGYINETFSLLCQFLQIEEDVVYESLDEMMAEASFNDNDD